MLCLAFVNVSQKCTTKQVEHSLYKREGRQASLRDFPHSNNGPCLAVVKNFPASIFSKCCQMT